MFATKEEKKRRLAMCASCPHLQARTKIIPAERCGKCGCVTVMIASIAAKQCPANRW